MSKHFPQLHQRQQFLHQFGRQALGFLVAAGFVKIAVSQSPAVCYIAGMTKFAQVLDSADGLALEEQESLVEVLQHRLAEHRRAELVAAVKAARQEFKAGRCRPATPAQIVKRLFA